MTSAKDGRTPPPHIKGVRQTWDWYISTLGEEGLKALRDAGVDPADPMAINDVSSHRLVSTIDGRGTEYDKMRESYFQRITKAEQIRKHRQEENMAEADPIGDFAFIIARQVVKAFDCSRSREVRFHCDCMRLAIGDPGMGSQKEVCERYGVSKAMLSWNVRKIQKRLALPRCIFNGNRTKP